MIGAPAPHRFDIAFDAASFGAVGLICGGLGCAIRRKGVIRWAACLVLAGVGATGGGFAASSCVSAASLPRGVEPDGIFHLSLALGQALIFAGVVLYTRTEAAGQSAAAGAVHPRDAARAAPLLRVE